MLILLLALLAGCSLFEEPPLLEKLDSETSGISFVNTVEPTDELNVLNYPLFYNGGGVALGDINNDGLTDIYLVGNIESSKLYLNEGEFTFSDITKSACVQTDQWITGVSMVDINNDNHLDIYLSVASPLKSPEEERRNLLFINNGDLTFTESAQKYGIDHSGFTTHATFLDYNRDGLLDLFLLNHSPADFARDLSTGATSPHYFRQETSHDKLFKNNGDGTFSDISEEAGILKSIGFGLGVVVSDFNNDDWPDIYVSNDITPDDVLYINNKDGTFTNKLESYFKHTSYAGMGVDASDFNNDGFVDMIQADMMPENFVDRKVMSGGIDYEYFYELRKQGFGYRYSQNSLQLNNGRDGDGHFIYSEIARLDNVAYTNWSWSALFADFDNTGTKDIAITNGYNKAVNNYDFLNRLANARRFGTSEIKKQKREKLLEELHGVHPINYFFKNKDTEGLEFEEVSRSWGFRDSTFSYGAAYGDLNNDGAIDLVVNNINSEASVYRNRSTEIGKNHYLLVQLHGDTLNTQGIGAKLTLNSGQVSQHHYHTLWRGYQSTVDGKVHFGLGEREAVDSLRVTWPDGATQKLTQVPTDTILHLYHENAKKQPIQPVERDGQEAIFTDITSEADFSYTHQEDLINDFKIQPLLHHQLSMLGPKIATGDVNGDQLDDFYITGSKQYAGTLFIQHGDGSFTKANSGQPWLKHKNSEELGALFFHANADEHLDLYVASGQYRYPVNKSVQHDRLYLNNGDGTFTYEPDALPEIETNTAAIAAGDFNGDGKQDLFVGGRMVSGRYPMPARSYILQNEGGNFSDVTEKVAPELVKSGMITDAVWADVNNDGQSDLITAGIWTEINFYVNNSGILEQSVHALPKRLRGWWYSLETGDFNNDGNIDVVAGNYGLNATFQTSEEQKLGAFAHDFDQNSILDILFTIKQDGKYIPFYGKTKLNTTFQDLNLRFPTYQSIANKPMSAIFGSEAVQKAAYFEADTFASHIFLNNGDGSFMPSPLPGSAQLSPVMGISTHDVDNDGNMDIILAGNIFRTEPEMPRLDAGNGLWLKGEGNGHFNAISPHRSGFLAPYDAKDIQLLSTGKGTSVLIGNNRNTLQLFNINK